MDFNELLNDEIEDLVAEGELEEGTAAYGVSQRVIWGDRLSPKRQWVFNTFVIPALERCKEELRLLEIMNSSGP